MQVMVVKFLTKIKVWLVIADSIVIRTNQSARFFESMITNESDSWPKTRDDHVEYIEINLL